MGSRGLYLTRRLLIVTYAADDWGEGRQPPEALEAQENKVGTLCIWEGVSISQQVPGARLIPGSGGGGRTVFPGSFGLEPGYETSTAERYISRA